MPTLVTSVQLAVPPTVSTLMAITVCRSPCLWSFEEDEVSHSLRGR